MKGDFCSIQGFTPSSRTLDAIDEMNNVIKMASLLDSIITPIPFFQIFAGRNSYMGVSLSSAGWNIATYDWSTYQDAMKSIPIIKRTRLENIADKAAMYSTGNDSDFWRCVSNAL